MARLFVPIWQFAKRKISPIASKIYQIRFKISPNSLKLLKNPSKFCLSGEFFCQIWSWNLPKCFKKYTIEGSKFCQMLTLKNFEISPNLVTCLKVMNSNQPAMWRSISDLLEFRMSARIPQLSDARPAYAAESGNWHRP